MMMRGVNVRVYNAVTLGYSACRSATRQLTTETQLQGVHLLRCPDGVGHVEAIAGLVARRGGSLVSCDIHVDTKTKKTMTRSTRQDDILRKSPADDAAPSTSDAGNCAPEQTERGNFYSRTVFKYPQSAWPRSELGKEFAQLSNRLGASQHSIRVPALDPPRRVAILCGTQDHCALDLVQRWGSGELSGLEMTCVMSNHMRRDDGELRAVLGSYDVPFMHIPVPTDAVGRRKAEERILQVVRDTDFIVLARYMQILSPEFLRSYGKDIVNIHHGLLPSFKGARPYKQAYESGVKMIGATAHFVTDELDAGPIIDQRSCRVDHRHSMSTLIQMSKDLERNCLAEAVKFLLHDRIMRDEQGRCLIMN